MRAPTSGDIVENVSPARLALCPLGCKYSFVDAFGDRRIDQPRLRHLANFDRGARSAGVRDERSRIDEPSGHLLEDWRSFRSARNARRNSGNARERPDRRRPCLMYPHVQPFDGRDRAWRSAGEPYRLPRSQIIDYGLMLVREALIGQDHINFEPLKLLPITAREI